MVSKVKQVTMILPGNLQLMGFRGYIEELASKYDLAGFVYNDVLDGTVKFVCEGETGEIEELGEEIKKSLGVEVAIQDRVLLPKPVGRVVVGIERDIFERLDLGVARLGSMDNRLASIEENTGSMDNRLASVDSTLKENSVLLNDIKKILQKIAEK